MTTITLEHVSKTFEQWVGEEPAQVKAVDDVSLKIVSGDVLAILGPSGCGKSTLLRIVAGLTAPDEGEVLYDNVPLRDIPWRDRGVGMVFQDSALMPHWEAGKSVGFFLWLRKREHEVPARVSRISQITGFGLDQLLGKRPAHLSGGEQQRVAIARALTRDPRVFLFDEPFSNLDAKLRTAARVELKRLLQEFPVTSIYVTHDQHEATALAHRIAVMREGRLVQVGTYNQLYSNPRNLFVATFIGTPAINLFEGFAVEAHWRGENFGGFRIRSDLDDGTRVILGVRPEHVLLRDGGVQAIVEEVIPYYAERFQLVQVRAGRERWQLLAPMERSIRPGDTCCCALDESGLLFFDRKTGLRIG
ncbi:MAG: ABC transporter ATP-binding protein [Chloroflexota bacterium]